MKSKKQFIFTPPLFTNNYTTKPSLKRGKYKMNILVLEDNLYDKTALLTLIKAWQNEAKHEVFIIAKESIEGDERSLQQFLNIDAAILDIETPGIDGLSFAKYLRKYNSRIDIAFISSHTEFLTSGFDVYACTFIEKPIPKEKIYSLLNYLWTRSIANENKEYIVVNIVTFYLLNVTAKATQALAKEQSTKTIEGLKEEQYKRLMETNEETRKWKHDIKNHIYTSIGFLQEGHPKDAETYLTNLVGSIQTSTFAIQSGNAILDAVLSTKISECIKKDITVHLDISIPDKYMKSIDVCSIIGNLMDNAINACELLPNDNRDIWIRLKPTKTFITLTVKNPIPPKEAELARKERQKGELHGIGLKQIEKRVANYNGIYLQVIENNLWVANVSIPLETDVIWLKTYCGTFGGVIRMAQTYEKVAKKYAATLVNRKIISPQEKNIHIYGMILLLNNSVIYILSLTIGLLIHQFLTTLLFLISFSLLRIHIGGLHAKTPLRCTIISVGICFASQIITIYSKTNSIYILHALAICFSIHLFVVTFIENKKDKIIGMVYIVVTMTSAIFLESNHKPESTTLLFAIFSVGMLKLLERVKTSYDKKEIRISKR